MEDFSNRLIPVVRVKDQPKKHKIINFGYPILEDGQVNDLYKFQYPPFVDQPNELYSGIIPAGFCSAVTVDETYIYLSTREGGVTGLEYQVGFDSVENPLHNWASNIDALWVDVIQALEERKLVSEDALEFLDCDPLFLFGIADSSTQKILEKINTLPTLKCLNGDKPTLAEWFSYLNADVEIDKAFTWVLEAFSQVELPENWTSYLGIGSIICFVDNETNETTWKHPFYDYFSQLLDHCRKASKEEHIKLRLNRLMWSYEAETVADPNSQLPLLSPKYVKAMADILEINLVEEPYLVRTLKTFLKAFSQQYRLEEELNLQEIKWCLEIIDNERSKYSIGLELPFVDDPSDKIDPNEQANLFCVECNVVCTCFCPDCKDCFCDDCFERLHAKGNRFKHVPNYIIQCCVCNEFPAKLQCTYTFGSYCHDCYRNKHVKTLPKFLDLKPIKIDYTKPYYKNPKALKECLDTSEIHEGDYGHGGSAVKKVIVGDLSRNIPGDGPGGRILAKGEVDPRLELTTCSSRTAPFYSLLGTDWHAFYDVRGIKYFYNFKTEESMRRPDDTKMTDDMEVVLKDTGLLTKVFDVPREKKHLPANSPERQDALRILSTLKGPRLLQENHVPFVKKKELIIN